MDLTLFWSLLLAMLISANSTQLRAKEQMNADENLVLENKAISLASSSADALNTDVGGIDTEVKSSASITTPSTVTKVVKSSSRRSARRSRRRSSRRSSRRRRRTKPSSRSSAQVTKQTQNRSKQGQSVTKTTSGKIPKTSDTAIEITTSSSVTSSTQPGHKTTRTTIYNKGTEKSPQATKIAPETQQMTLGEPEVTTKSVTFKQSEHRFIDAAKEKNGKAFSTATTKTEANSTAPALDQNEARPEVMVDSRSDSISPELSNSHKMVGEAHRSIVTKESNKHSLLSDTDNVNHVSIPATTAVSQPQKLVNGDKNRTTDFSAVTHTSGRDIASSTSRTLPFHMANMTKTLPIENGEQSLPGDVKQSPSLTKPSQKPITKVPRQGQVPIASVLARILPYLAGMLGSRHVIVQRIGPETIARGSEGSFLNPTVQRLPGRRRLTIQSIPVRLNFEVPPLFHGNRGQMSVSFLNRNQGDIHKQRALCSETPSRLRTRCLNNTDCQHKMECYSGKCCATSDGHAERLDNMLDYMNRRRTRRFRIRH